MKDECIIRGCRNLNTICEDCGRLVVSRILPPSIEWIPIKEKIPEEYLWVLVLAMNNESSQPCPISFAMLRDDEWYFLNEGFNNAVVHGDSWSDMMTSDITHWMALPDLPKE